MAEKNGIKIFIVIFLLFCLTFFLRFQHIFWGLDLNKEIHYYEDEGHTVLRVFYIEKGFNPHYFINPTFYYYSIFLSSKIAEKFHYIDYKMQDKSLLIVKLLKISRSLSGIFGIFSVFFLFMAVKNLYKEKMAIISSLIFSVIYPAVYFSHIALVDSSALFWNTAGFYVLTLDLKSIRKFLILSSFVIGMAISSKYTNFLLLIPFAVKITTEKYYKNLKWHSWILAFFILLAGFLLFTPYAVLDIKHFLFGNASGFGGIFGERGLFGYNRFSPGVFTPFLLTIKSIGLSGFVLFLWGLIIFFIRHNKSDKIVLSYIISFYVIMISNSSPYIRHYLPVLPYIAILISAIFIYPYRTKKLRFVQYLLPLFLIYHIFFSSALNKFLGKEDARDVCVKWVLTNIQEGKSFGYGKISLSKPGLYFFKRYKALDLFYSKRKLLNNLPDYIVLTDEDMLYNQMWYLMHLKRQYRNYEKKLHLDIIDVHRQFFQSLYKNYTLYKVFKTRVPFNLKFPQEIILEIHPSVYLFRRVDGDGA